MGQRSEAARTAPLPTAGAVTKRTPPAPRARTSYETTLTLAAELLRRYGARLWLNLATPPHCTVTVTFTEDERVLLVPFTVTV